MSNQNHHHDHPQDPHHSPGPKKKKKVHHRITKYLMERDTLLATVWVFIFIVVLGSIPLDLGIVNPIKLGLKDFDFNDLSYSKLGKAEHTNIDKRIVIVNIGYATREELAMMIDKVGSMKPKVMGLDALFYEARDPHQDSMLMACFAKNKNLIAARKLVLSGKDGDSVSEISGDYINTASQYAHVNFFQDSVSSIRTFEPFYEDHAHKLYPFFSTAIVKQYDGAAYEKLEKKGAKKVIINYTRHTNQYLVVDYMDVLGNNVDDSAFLNKIVLFGYVNINPNDIEDKKFTPMNPRFAGKSVPDMNGIVVHANIISMALDNNYVKKVPLWGNILLAILVCWLHMSFFVHYYLEAHIWFHLAAKIAQVISAIFFVWLGIYLYDRYRLKVDMKLSLVTIVLAVDVIYFYEAWAVWMHKKFNYKTVFKPHHH
jgi:CHASE2 domain-containing sensor protein